MSNQPALPINSVLELTYKCNQKCLYCSCPWELSANPDGRSFRMQDADGCPKYEKGEELNLPQWKKAIDILAANGVKKISLSGGETLLKPELLDIISYIREKNVLNADKYITVFSNGLAMNEDYLQFFKKHKVRLSLSIPGINTFEKLTGADNSLGVLHWFRRASKEGVSAAANVTVTGINYHELRETISNALTAGADSLLLNRFLTGGRGVHYQENLSLSHEQINGMLDTAEDVLSKAGRYGVVGTQIPFCVIKGYTHNYKQLKIGFKCAAARSFFVVDPSGKVRVCNHSPRVLGHIFDENLITEADYWYRFVNRDFIPDVCSHCTDISICDCGCREAANIVTGSIRSVDPCMKGYEEEMSKRVETIGHIYENEFDKKFEDDFRGLFTDRLRENEKFGNELWSAMANVSWIHKDDPEQSYCRRSFRGAGALLAVMEGKDKYTKWYCSGPYETVSGFIAKAMASKGWRYEKDGYGTDIYLEEKMMIEKVEIPHDRAEIPEWEFAHNDTVCICVIPDNIRCIGKCAFAHCRNLEKIDIGENVSYIGKYAFRKDNRTNNSQLKEVINRSENPQIINKYHFHNIDLENTVLYVPEESIAAYLGSDGWKEFGDIKALTKEMAQPKQQSQLKQREHADGDEPDYNIDIKNPNFFQTTAHVWICNFDSEEELEEYADNHEYEWDYYGHLLGEDNFDESPEEQGLGCSFCYDNNLMFEEAADVCDDLVWKYFNEEKPVNDILAFLHPFPVNIDEALEACKKKYPNIKKINSYIVVFGWSEKKDEFEKAVSSKKCFYLGEFELPEEDTDAQYEGND